MIELKRINLGIVLESELFTEKDFVDFAETILPGIIINRTAFKPDVKIFTIFATKGVCKLYYDQTKICISGDYDSYQIMRDSVMFISHIIENHLNIRNCFSMHSAVLSKGNSAIILAGNSGAGKTSTALYTNFLDNSFNLVSGDRTVISGNKIISGTEVFNARKGILLKIPSQYSSILNNNSWSYAYKIRPLVPTYNNFKIKAIYYPYQVPDDSIEIQEYLGDIKFLNLYDSLAYFSKTSPSICLGQKKPFPIPISLNNENRRIRLAKYLADNFPVYRIIGSMEKLAKYIINNF